LGPEHENFIGTLRNVGYKFESTKEKSQADEIAEEVENRINR
jgi:hypothetical protein